jgi:hypothetical protein
LRFSKDYLELRLYHMVKINRKVLLLLAVLLFSISYSPPLGFSYLEPVIGSENLPSNFSPIEVNSYKLPIKETANNEPNYSNLDYFQVGPDIKKDELSKYDEERQKKMSRN